MRRDMTDVTLDEVRDAVEKATDKSTFSLVEAIKGRGYPTEEVTVYTNADAAYNLAETNALLETLAQGKQQDTEEYDNLDAVAQQLKAEVQESALTFSLRGISPGEVQRLSKKVAKQARAEDLDEDEEALLRTAAWFAPHVVRVSNAQGEVDEHLYTAEEARVLMDLLPQSEWNKLLVAMSKLSLGSMYFDQLVDAGFLPKS
jgi:hypothetical protein